MFKSTFCLMTLFSLSSFAIPQKFLDSQMKIPLGKNKMVTFLKAGTSGATPALKAAEWRACHQQKIRVFSGGESLESVSDFIENPEVISNLEEMNRKSLLRGEVRVSPWSGDYWPYASGLIAARYKDMEFYTQYKWRKKFEYIQTHPVSQVIASQGQTGVDLLSPAEKYDLLSGSEKSALAASMWAQGEYYEDENGEVENWMGICHGWAAAAIMESRPSQSVELKSADDQWVLSLLPSEIKGLVSYSWAHNPYASISLGSRCQQREPIRDAHGRLTDSRCQDMNPGTWHQVVVNMVGRQKRSFVMDATYDYEVWNQPVKAYSYTYYDLNTQESSARFQDVILKVSDVKDDKFSSYRSPQTQYLIGVSMKLAYVSETAADEESVDLEKNDSVIWVEYRYDLELDSKYNVIGGEWYSDAHPDFVWTPLKKARPFSTFDFAMGVSQWSSAESQLPISWGSWARQASEQGQILHRIVEEIVDRSH